MNALVPVPAELDPESRLPAACDVYERGVSLTGVSKTLGCPGLRIGWLACRGSAVLGRVGELKDWTTICSSAPSEVRHTAVWISGQVECLMGQAREGAWFDVVACSTHACLCACMRMGVGLRMGLMPEIWSGMSRLQHGQI